MQPHEKQDQEPDSPKRKQPDPRDMQAKWLLFAIAILLGMITARKIARCGGKSREMIGEAVEDDIDRGEPGRLPCGTRRSGRGRPADFCKAAVTSGTSSAAICACAAVVKWMRSNEKYSGGKTGSKTISLMPRSRNRRSIAPILAARCSLVPKNLRSLPPGCKMTKSVPGGAAESMRRSIPAVVAATTPALMTWASRPFALRRASSCAGNALCLPTPHPQVLLAPTATIWTGSAAAGLHAIGRRTTTNAPTNLRLMMSIAQTKNALCMRESPDYITAADKSGSSSTGCHAYLDLATTENTGL